jgi:rubrerythrin
MILTPGKNKNLHATLIEFAYAEYGSALEMLAAAKKTKNPKLKLGYIRHALDEYRHSSLILKVLDNEVKKNNSFFEKEYKFVPQNVISKGYVDKGGFLIEKLKLKKFVEFVYSNEFLATKAFEELRKRIKNDSSIKIIDNIIKDESQHSDYSMDKLNEIMKDEFNHWNFAKKFYEKKFPDSNIKFAFFLEKLKNKMRVFYLKNFNFLTKIFDPIINSIIFLFGKIVLMIKIDKQENNLLSIKSDSVI